MKTAAILCVGVIAVLGALAMFVPSLKQQAEQQTKMVQFCLPDENFEIHRFYCRLSGG